MNAAKIKLLEKSFNQYWAGGETCLTDERFDQLISELVKDDPSHPLLTRLGLNVARGEKVKHEKPMLSLNKVYSFEDLKKWVDQVSRGKDEQFIVQYKFDGLAGKLSGGVLSTRGDGTTGENISRRKKDIRLILNGVAASCLVLPPKVAQEDIFGEIVVNNEYFEKSKNCIPGNTFKHPRNFVIGMVNRKEDLPPGIKLDFVVYDHSPLVQFTAEELNSGFWSGVVSGMQNKKEYPTDGFVIKLKDKKYADSLGFTTHHPNGAIAFKLYGDRVWTQIDHVEWGMGRECLTPVAVFQPIRISGSTIDRATVHNAKMFLDLNIRAGDFVEIEKAGEIIPHITGVRKGDNTGKATIPASCPYCHGEVAIAGVEAVCCNDYCPEKELKRFFSSVTIFGIDGLGENTLRALFDRGVKDMFMLLSVNKQDILNLAGFQQKSADNLFNAIQKAKRITAAKLLTSLNTPGIGDTIYKTVLNVFTLDELLTGANFEKLSAIKGIGETRAREIKRGIHRNKPLLEKLIPIIEIVSEQKTNGDTVCFTGKMPNSRSFYEKAARDRGLTPVNTVNKDLKLLVTTEIDRKSSKMDAAKKYGVRIITLEQWESEKI